jgi:hypothetical protein
MYCWQIKAPKKNLTGAHAEELWKFTRLWNGGLFSKSIATKPSRGPNGGPDGKGKSDPILDIPITRVHFCTLHAMFCLVEKIVYMQISYVCIIKDEVQRKEAIEAMEWALSKAGLCGGAVVLQKDPKLSGENTDLPSKLSFNGSKCKKMFQPFFGQIMMLFGKTYVRLSGTILIKGNRNIKDKRYGQRLQSCYHISPNYNSAPKNVQLIQT